MLPSILQYWHKCPWMLRLCSVSRQPFLFWCQSIQALATHIVTTGVNHLKMAASSSQKTGVDVTGTGCLETIYSLQEGLAPSSGPESRDQDSGNSSKTLFQTQAHGEKELHVTSVSLFRLTWTRKLSHWLLKTTGKWAVREDGAGGYVGLTG